MSEEDIEIIPILDDVLVAGDPDKAVTGDIDVKNLESIERFDALFEDKKSDADDNLEDENSSEYSPAVENIEAEPQIYSSDDLTDSQDFNFIHDERDIEPDTSETDNVEAVHAAYEETSPPETFELTGFSETDVESDTSKTTEINFDQQNNISDFSNTDPYSAPSFLTENDGLDSINESLMDEVFEDTDTADDSDEEAGDTAYHPETIAETEVDSFPGATQQEAPLDINQMLETVMQEIMPEIETQIRSIVRSSLEKHLSKPNTDSDNDL